MRPDFQRRLVWTRENKNHFLDSILRGYPFPEIYFADGDVDLDTGQGNQLLVDGLQRVSTILQYFDADPQLRLTTISAYRELSKEEKEQFLQYDVAVRDLGLLARGQIIEVFQRINATKYALLDIEINNAVYAGALKKFAEAIAGNSFFAEKRVFSTSDLKRMGDVRFALTLVITLLSGYFNRDDSFQEMLERFNDDFPRQAEIANRLEKTIEFINELGMLGTSRAWRKADLLSLMVELDQLINVQSVELEPSPVVGRLEHFYARVDEGRAPIDSPEGVYSKAAIQASNDRSNRLRRGVIVSHVLQGVPPGGTILALEEAGLLPHPEDPLLPLA